MTVYAVLRTEFSTGTYGDLEYSKSTFWGVFSTKELAEEVVKSFPQGNTIEGFTGIGIVEPSTGVETPTYHIIPTELDAVNRNEDAGFYDGYWD